jgi:hypothetical protein
LILFAGSWCARNYAYEIAETTEQAKELIEKGFEYVTGQYDDGGKLFRKRK